MNLSIFSALQRIYDNELLAAFKGGELIDISADHEKRSLEARALSNS